MSGNEAKRIGATSILVGMGASLILAVFAWVGIQASAVPKLEVQITNLNDSIGRLATVISKVDEALQDIDKANVLRNSKLQDTVKSHTYKINSMDKDCAIHRDDVVKCLKDVENIRYFMNTYRGTKRK